MNVEVDLKIIAEEVNQSPGLDPETGAKRIDLALTKPTLFNRK